MTNVNKKIDEATEIVFSVLFVTIPVIATLVLTAGAVVAILGMAGACR